MKIPLIVNPDHPTVPLLAIATIIMLLSIAALLITFPPVSWLNKQMGRSFSGLMLTYPPNLEFINQNGDFVTITDLNDKPLILATGFTQCVHICPIIIQRLTELKHRFGEKINTGFISIDPQDNPGRLKAFLAHTKNTVHGLIPKQSSYSLIGSYFTQNLTRGSTVSEPVHGSSLHLIVKDYHIRYELSSDETLTLDLLNFFDNAYY